MSTISEAHADVQRDVQAMLAIVDKPGLQTATAVEVALWVGMLRLGASMMTVFFAHQAARWPVGLHYVVGGVAYKVEGADSVEIGTKFGRVAVQQPMGREAGRRPRSPRGRTRPRGCRAPSWSPWSARTAA
jgi:hypothetical protein